MPPETESIIVEDTVPIQAHPNAAGPILDSSPSSQRPSVIIGGGSDNARPQNHGINEISTTIKMLETAGLQCCVVSEPAVIYYGAHRVMSDWKICVPTDKLEEYVQLLRDKPDTFERAEPNSLREAKGISHLYPRFKFKGVNLFLLLLTSQACHMPCTAQNVEYSDNGIPYPKLPIFVQSLLETNNKTDLEDLIDGMDLTEEWGEEHLDLEAFVDREWIKWRHELSTGQPWKEKAARPPTKFRVTWAKRVTDEAKRDRQGMKYQPEMITRFWHVGQEDPRISTRKTR